jgi:hypothetical protein
MSSDGSELASASHLTDGTSLTGVVMSEDDDVSTGPEIVALLIVDERGPEDMIAVKTGSLSTDCEGVDLWKVRMTELTTVGGSICASLCIPRLSDKRLAVDKEDGLDDIVDGWKDEPLSAENFSIDQTVEIIH